jgi:ribosome-binding factor A
MQQFKEQRYEELMRNCAANFIQRESNGTSLITVTGVNVAHKLMQVTIYFTVLPEEKQAEALDFLQRNRSEFREYLKDHSRLGRLPTIQFELDFGEKNRQRIDELSKDEDARMA